MRLRVWLAAAVVAVLGAGSATAVVRLHRREPITPPTLRIEQTAAYVKVHIHNPNKHWGVYDQRVILDLHDSTDPGRLPTRSYGPDTALSEHGGHAGPVIHCCLIDRLPPRGDFTFTLWPDEHKIVAVRIDLYDGNHWRYER